MVQRRIYNPNDIRQVQDVVNELVSQFDGNTGSFLLSNATTTVVFNAKITPHSRVFLQPLSAVSASAGTYITSVSSGSFTVNHNTNSSERKFDYVVFDI